MSFEVVWDGAHRNINADLFRQPDAAPTSTPVMGKKKRISRAETTSFVLEVLPTNRREALTTREIRAKTGCSEDQVTLALSRLRKDGLLLTAGEWPPRVYWRKA